jgi:ComF family protein
MKRFFTLFLDFLFPPSPEALKLRQLSPEELYVSVPRAVSTGFPFITPLFSYKDPLVKELVLSIKSRKDPHAFACAAHALYKNLPAKAVLVPIPISRTRRNERGYNQCELLIEEIVKLDAEKKFQKNFALLIRAKDRGEQKTKNRKERFGSTTNIFKVNKIEITDPIVIIDDVCTTGSTLKEARDALLSAGYENVTALTLAH